MKARLLRIDVPERDWWYPHRHTQFVYAFGDGKTETIDESYVPTCCRTIGEEYELHYVFFSLGPAEGYHYEVRKPGKPVEQTGDCLPFEVSP
jgi:hypothetical protein